MVGNPARLCNVVHTNKHSSIVISSRARATRIASFEWNYFAVLREVLLSSCTHTHARSSCSTTQVLFVRFCSEYNSIWYTLCGRTMVGVYMSPRTTVPSTTMLVVRGSIST